MLPTTMQSRRTLEVTPAQARVMLAGMPKSGKTTLLAGWKPATTLIIDTHKGTTLLDGEHFAQPVATWNEFVTTVDDIVKGDHPFETIGIDLVDDIWKFADLHAAEKSNVVAAGLVEYGKGIAEAEGLFRQQIGRLLATSYGVWFVSHTDTVEENKIQRYVPRLDKRVRTYIQGAVQFVFLAETLGTKRVLHTAPSQKFEAGSRVPLPEPMDLDARALWLAMDKGLNPEKHAKKPNSSKLATETESTTREAVAA